MRSTLKYNKVLQEERQKSGVAVLPCGVGGGAGAGGGGAGIDAGSVLGFSQDICPTLDI